MTKFTKFPMRFCTVHRAEIVHDWNQYDPELAICRVEGVYRDHGHKQTAEIVHDWNQYDPELAICRVVVCKWENYVVEAVRQVPTADEVRGLLA